MAREHGLLRFSTTDHQLPGSIVRKALRLGLGFLPLLSLLLIVIATTDIVGRHGLAQGPPLADHVVISEVQVGGSTANDEFVELYNPTSSPITMSGWRLTKKASTGTKYNLVSSLNGTMPNVKLLGGDANRDSTINILDLSFMGGKFSLSSTDSGWDPKADINGDGRVNILDLTVAGSNFGQAAPSPWP